MRTRFLNTDYFAAANATSTSTAAPSPSSSIGTLTFLNLPLPSLTTPPPPPLPSLSDFNFDPLPVISLGFPIDASLSKFLPQVIPQFLDAVDIGDFDGPLDSEASSCSSSALCGERHRTSSSHSDREEPAADVDGHGHGREDVERLEVIQFEAPELHVFLENACISEDENGMQFLSQDLEMESDLVPLRNLLRPGITPQHYDKVLESVYMVEDVNFDYEMDHKPISLEEDGSVEPRDSCHSTFPLLEVDDISLSTFTNLSVQDELHSIFEITECSWVPEDNLLGDELELLGNKQVDILEFLSGHCLSKQHLESELPSLDKFQETDFLCMLETAQAKEEAADCFSPMNPLVFQEFKLLFFDSSELYEVFFERQVTDEPGNCDSMFSKNMGFKDFNELIVSCELALADDTFKSLPVPILSDYHKIRSTETIVLEILGGQKLQPLSASDGIYLDWHLLGEDKCGSHMFSFYQNMLKELNSYRIDFDWELLDDGKSVIDLVLYDDALESPRRKEYKELLTGLSEASSDFQSMGVSASDSAKEECIKPARRDQSAQESAGKASVLFKSMSQFNDLDFFLNPGKATLGVNGESASKPPDSTTTLAKEVNSHAIFALDGKTNGQKFEELLDAVPVEEKDNGNSLKAADIIEDFFMPLAAPCAPVNSEQTQRERAPLPGTVIIVNTQNFDNEMIVSRRSTYQRILAMEKQGAQVLERDIDLPVDIMVSSSVCLAWYDCRNIGKKASAKDEASSCLPLCIENIATNVLTLLSFAFSGCILVFEGEISFLSTVIESSDGLYAAAASLGIDLQLFCSYSPDLTDEIILNTNLYASKLYGGIYPKMPESETLAESFLTKFPSINPLTAHAIVSSGGILIEFLEWSHERRTLALQQYHVSEESVALFSALCRYGEREDSRSIMTDCSSSVSSGLDSDKCQVNVGSERKRRKCTKSPQKIGIDVADTWQAGSFDLFTDAMLGPSAEFQQQDRWMPTNSQIVNEVKWPHSSRKDIFCQKQGLDISQTIDSSTIYKTADLHKYNGPLIALRNKLECNKTKTSKLQNVHEDFAGEVFDLTDCALLDMDVPAISNSTYFSQWSPHLDSARKSKAARRLSFGINSGPTFPVTADVNSDPDIWNSVNDQRQNAQEMFSGYPADVDKHNKEPAELQKRVLEEVLTQRAGGNSQGLSFKEEISHYGKTPLSKAIHSAHPQSGSPWTIEFLNRIREKSKLRKQSLPCETSTPSLGYSGNKSNVTKISPSIFKYQGGSNPRKVQERKKQKRSMQLANSSKNERTSASLLPTWTPADKKSGMTLPFAMDDSGSQTRLVWSDGSAHRLSKRFRNQ